MSALNGGRAGGLAAIVRLYGEAYRRSHRLSSDEQKALWAIESCRTAVLGGHLERCGDCGFERPCYNSCRNRHCPSCQHLPKARWLEAREAELLPVPYFHVVFTLPHEMNPVALARKKAVYDLLFKAASQTLLKFGEKTLGGRMGATMILHTWDQQLRHHIHLHCAIAGVALGQDGKIRRARKQFLFPVKAMGTMFRGIFVGGLKKQGLADDRLVRSLYEKDWVVYAKRAFDGAAHVLDYLGRYTHRVAISNERIVSVEGGRVTFSYRDRADGNRRKMSTVPAEEFLRRFLVHILPSSFVKVRHIGFLSNKRKKQDLALLRERLSVTEEACEKKTTAALMKELTGVDLERCPRCREGRMVIVGEIPKQRWSLGKGWDTS